MPPLALVAMQPTSGWADSSSRDRHLGGALHEAEGLGAVGWLDGADRVLICRVERHKLDLQHAKHSKSLVLSPLLQLCMSNELI